MPLIKDNQAVADPWVAPAADEPLPEGEPAIVSLERWQAERETLIGRNAPLGIRLRSDQPPGPIAEDLERFAVVALEFPKFTDGRAYSYARLLRERYGYRGEVRAVGKVLRDQALFLLRCGFDAFEVADDTALAGWREALSEISVAYQPTGDGRRSAAALRHPARGKGKGNGNGWAGLRAEGPADGGDAAGDHLAPAAARPAAPALNA